MAHASLRRNAVSALIRIGAVDIPWIAAVRPWKFRKRTALEIFNSGTHEQINGIDIRVSASPDMLDKRDDERIGNVIGQLNGKFGNSTAVGGNVSQIKVVVLNRDLVVSAGKR